MYEQQLALHLAVNKSSSAVKMLSRHALLSQIDVNWRLRAHCFIEGHISMISVLIKFKRLGINEEIRLRNDGNQPDH